MNRINRPRLRGAVRAAAAALLAVMALPAALQAQIDPLISLKRVPPRVLIVFDTSFSMLYDMSGYDRGTGLGAVYCDPAIYYRTSDTQVATALGVEPPANAYRRSFANLAASGLGGYTASGVTTVTDQSAAWANPCAGTRYEIARKGVTWALRRSGNPRLHWGLVRLRQNAPTWRVENAAGCEKATAPVAGHDASPCDAGVDGVLAINPPTVAGLNSLAAGAAPLLLSATNQAATLANTFFDSALIPLPTTAAQATANRLIPAGRDTAVSEDRPLALTLDDARAEIVRAMSVDALATARNTVVVLIAAGRDHAGDPVTKAANFLSVSGGGAARRVPIYVVGVSPKTLADETQLARIAAASGGLYVHAANALGVERAVNLAIQAGCRRAADVDAGRASEFPLVSPVVGTVNLDDAAAADGTPLPNTVISTPTGTHIPQRNNIMITTAFALGPSAISYDHTVGASTASWNPGFEGRMRAVRAFKPVADSARPSGYTFTKDGTQLWPDRDGRPELAGLARAPIDPDQRNIFTYVPGIGMVPFRTDQVASLQAAMNASNALEVIQFVRRLPLGAMISSTPAVMDPPSLDPPPDEDYGRSDTADTYAGDHKARRSIIWVGANDGMLHAIDARTGYEVWAFIPYNLLPKLQTLLDGQSPYEFTYFVDHSAKIAEVKMSGEWKSMLIIGEGWGGTFYQAFDVTEAGMGGPDPDSDDYAGVLASFASSSRVEFKWAFPDYTQFDPLAGGGKVYMQVADTTSFGRVKFFGDLKVTASPAEKKVGFAWSDPAVGALDAARSVNAAIVGSGYFPPEADATTSPLAARIGAGVGRAFYLINMATGKLVGNASGASCSGTGCLDVGAIGGATADNAIQADPTVTSDYGSYVAKRAYLGDLDGNYWRFAFNAAGTITKTLLKATGQPIYASSALMWVGSTQQYIFFSTGSDMLPTSPVSVYGVGTFKLYGLKEIAGVVTDAFTPVSMAAVTNVTPESPAVTDYRGQAIGVPAGERPSTSPSVAGEIVFFTTTVEGGAPGNKSTAAAMTLAEPTYNLYALTYSGTNGYLPAGSTTVPRAVTPIRSGAGRATAPFVVDQHIYFATSSGSGASVEAFGDPNDFNNGVGQVGVRILSWREIRR